MKTKIFLAAMVIALSSVAQAGGDPEAGKAKSLVCAGCHGADGNSMANPEWPNLAGQHASYIEKQLSEFKSGARQDPIMMGQVAMLNEADMANLAAYFSSQKVKGGETDPAAVELGKKIYTAGLAKKGVSACTACHGPTGAGNPAAGFPAISGQHAKYTTKQLNAFKTGTRANDANKMMRMVAENLNAAEIEAVSQYMQGLH